MRIRKYWTYTEDFIILDDALDAKGRRKAVEGKKPNTRYKILKRYGLTQKSLLIERQQIIDIYPDYDMKEISKYLNREYNYITQRVSTLNDTKAIRDKALLNDNLKEYIKKNKNNLSAETIALKLKLPYHLVKIALVKEFKTEKRNVDKLEEKIDKADRMPKKTKPIKPKDALDKNIIGSVKYKDNAIYEITLNTDPRKRDKSNYFVGKLIYQDKDFIILKHKLGYKESFQKVDFETREKSIKEVVM